MATYKTSHGKQAPVPEIGSVIMIDQPRAGADGAGTNPDCPPVPYLVVMHWISPRDGTVALIAAPGTGRDLDKLKPGEFVVDRRDHIDLQWSLKFDLDRKHLVPCIDRAFDITGKVAYSLRTLREIEDDYEARLKVDSAAERRGYMKLDPTKVLGLVKGAQARLTKARAAQFNGVVDKVAGRAPAPAAPEERVSARPAMR